VPEPAIRANETTVPMLPCVCPEDTLQFYRALGFAVTYEQTKPYLYLIVEWSGFALHFGKQPKGIDPDREDAGGCVVFVDAVAPYHAALTQAMRRAYGKVLASGRPRITRYRPGASRFTLFDPSGNSIVFVQRDEPLELEYGGSKELEGIAKALDNARIYREFKNDDLAASRTIKSALRKHGPTASAVDRALAIATLVELAIAMDEPDEVASRLAELDAVELTATDRALIESDLGHVAALRQWLDGGSATSM
jgi:hypothetical protein